MHFFLKLSKTYQSNIIYPCLTWACQSPTVACIDALWLSVTLPAHLMWFQAVHAQPSRWITPLPHPPLGTDSHPSSSVCTLYHSPHIFTELHFPPQLEKHHLLGQIPNQPPPPPTSLCLNLPDSFSTLTSPQQEATPAALRHFLSEMLTLHPNRILLHAFFLFSCRDLCLLCVLEKSCRLAICFLALFPAPTVEAVFSVTGCVWTLNLVSHTQPWPLFSPWPSPPCEQVPGINHTFSSPLLESYHFIHNVLWGGCHLYSRINKAVCQLDLLFKIKNMNLLQWV